MGGAIGAIGGGIGGTDTRGIDKSIGTTYNKGKSSVSPAAVAQVQQMAQEEQITRAVKPEAEVLDTGATLYTELGMRPNRAKEKAEIVQRLVAGDRVDVKDINKLNLTDKAYRTVFTQLTGVQFPDGRLSNEQVYNLARSAAQEAVTAKESAELQQKQVEAVQKAQEALTKQMQGAQEVQSQQAVETLQLDNGGAITQEQFTKLVTEYYAGQGVAVSPQQAGAMFAQLKSQGVILQNSPEMDLILKEGNTSEVQKGSQEEGAVYPAHEQAGSQEDVGRGAEVSGGGVRGSTTDIRCIRRC